MYLLCDIGGTNTRIAISEDGKTLTSLQTFPTDQNFEKALENIIKTSENHPLTAAAFGVAGTFDKEKTTLTSSPNLPLWVQKPIKQTLENALKCPVYLENDAALGGLGEALFGAGKDYKIVAYLTIGTGVGGVRIVDGKIDRNTYGFEPGHQVIVMDGVTCHCGGKGHLESYVGGAYLKEPINWDEVAKYLNIGIHNTIAYWSPEIIILNGAVGQKMPLDKILTNPAISKSTLNEQAGLYGALSYLSMVK